MKKFLLALVLLCFVTPAFADSIMIESNVNMTNFWEKNGKEAEKVETVAHQIIHTNGLKRAPIMVERNWRVANASTNTYTKSIFISVGLLPYIDSDDELAFVLGHELAHAQEAYGGALKLIAMKCNGKKYEYKSDLTAIDYMVKAGYNPVASILVGNKIFDEPLWDWGFTYTHPKGSKRLIAMYEYIYKKYPQYLNSDLAKTDSFQDFLNQNEKEISAFKQGRDAKKLESSL